MDRVFFGAGRIGRIEYLMWTVGLSALYVMALFVTSGGDLVARDINDLGNRMLLILPIAWVSFAQAVRRAHDRNHTGWLVVLYAFPILNLCAWGYLQFAPSYDITNRWGGPAEAKMLTAEELAQAKAVLAADAEDSQRQRDEELLTDDGSFDMDGLFRSNPGARHD